MFIGGLPQTTSIHSLNNHTCQTLLYSFAACCSLSLRCFRAMGRLPPQQVPGSLPALPRLFSYQGPGSTAGSSIRPEALTITTCSPIKKYWYINLTNPYSQVAKDSRPSLLQKKWLFPSTKGSKKVNFLPRGTRRIEHAESCLTRSTPKKKVMRKIQLIIALAICFSTDLEAQFLVGKVPANVCPGSRVDVPIHLQVFKRKAMSSWQSLEAAPVHSLIGSTSG